MHYDYVVTLKKDSSRKTDWVGFLLLGFSILAFIYIQIHRGFRLTWMIAVLIISFGWIANFYSLVNGKEIRFRSWLFGAGICWIAMPFLQWMILPFFLIGFLEVQAKRPLEIAFNKEGLLINTLFKKRIEWQALNSVILKDGMLTLDFRNNRLFQKEVMDDGESDTEEDEFNDYCESKLLNLH